MTPREEDIFETAARCINPTLGYEPFIVRVRIQWKCLRINILIRESTTNGERVLSASVMKFRWKKNWTWLTPTMAHWSLSTKMDEFVTDHDLITHSGWKVVRSFPRSCTRPTTCIHSGFPSRRIASAVCKRCSIWVTLVCLRLHISF